MFQNPGPWYKRRFAGDHTSSIFLSLKNLRFYKFIIGFLQDLKRNLQVSYKKKKKI